MTNVKEEVKMTNNNVLTNGGNTNEAMGLFEAFVQGGLTVTPILPVGEHRAVWQGLDIDMKAMSFTLRFTVDNKEYLHTLQYTPEKATRIVYTLQDLARQFGLDGKVMFNDYNNYIGQEFIVWAVKVEGYSGIFYNYKAPKTAAVAATEAAISDSTEF